MQFVSARLCRNTDVAAAGPAILRFECGRFNPKLLYRVHVVSAGSCSPT